MKKTCGAIENIRRLVAGVLMVLMIACVPLAGALLSSQDAYADAKSQVQSGLSNVSGASTGDDLPGIASKVVNVMLFIVGILAVIMIIFSGIRYITAHGDKGQIESAKNTLIYSIVGLVVAIIAYAIVSWVTGLFSSGSSAAGSGASSYVLPVVENILG